MQPTSEQQDCIDLFTGGMNLAIEAGSGTGKTSVLRMLARSTTQQGQYLAFNSSIVTEASTTMPGNLACRTIHGAAMQFVGRHFRHRLGSPRMLPNKLAEILGVERMVIDYGDTKKVLQAGFLASHALKAVRNFCQSDDEVPTAKHIAYIDGIDEPDSDGVRTWANNALVRGHMTDALTVAWADLSNPAGRLPYFHDAYVKVFELNDPQLFKDFLLLDEAQDLSPVMISIARQQRDCQVVYVGDSCQSIYSWRGAQNALQTVSTDAIAYLSQSFRFGQRVADVANLVLAQLDAELRLTGNPAIDSVVAPLLNPTAVLTRTNAVAVSRLFEFQRDGVRAHLIGGGTEVAWFAKGAKEIMETGSTNYHDLACFTSWGQVQEYVSSDPSGDELKLLVDLVDEFGVDPILRALQNMPDEHSAQVVISTAHKCVHPDTLVEGDRGLVRMSELPGSGVIGTPTGAHPYHSLVSRTTGPCLRLVTRGGYEITITPDHGMTAWRDGGHTRVAGGDLCAGDLLRVRLGSTHSPDRLMALPTPMPGDVREVLYDTPAVLTHDMAEFLGLMVADGTVFRGGFRLTKRYESVVHRFCDLTLSLFGRAAKVIDCKGTPGAEVQSRYLERWLLSIDGLAPKAKAIPAAVRMSPLSVQAAFLRGLFEDGTVNEKNGHIDHVHWENRDRDVAAVVQTMLLRFGIIATRRTHHSITTLYLYGQNARTFANRIGFVSPEKNERLTGSFGRSTKFTVPVSATEIDSLRPVIHASAPGNWRRQGGRLSRDTLTRAALVNDAPWLVERLGWHYDEIAEIEHVESETMCVSVPDGSRFLQNGFDGWNSKGREWPSVQLASDFMDPADGRGGDEEYRLLYVALTRAQFHLDIAGCAPLVRLMYPQREQAI